jgi:hypothetical protein
MNAVPPKISAAAGQQPVAWLLALAALVGAAVVFAFNPATSRFYPVCHFHQLTGLHCPGCGMTRAAHALLHGDLAAALRDNALFVGILLLLALRGAWFGLNRLRGGSNGVFFKAAWLWPLLVIAVAFAVLRNLPAGAFLSP